MRKIYLILFDKITRKTFTKYFKTEFEKDKFARKLDYSNKLYIIEDSKDKGWDD